MKTIYFSTSVFGVRNISADFPAHIVEVMKKKGFSVLTEHVVQKDQTSLFKKLSENSGKDIPKRTGYEKIIREVDMKWADEADIFVFILDGASHGVGMELQYALLKKKMGLTESPILGLVHVNHYEKLSSFIKGIRQDNFRLMVYTTEDVAKKYVEEFLSKYE